MITSMLRKSRNTVLHWQITYRLPGLITALRQFCATCCSASALRGNPLSESKAGGAFGEGTAPAPPEIDAGDRGVGDEMLPRSGLCGCFDFTLFVNGFAFKSACEFGNESVDIADSPSIPPIFVASGYEIGKALVAMDEGGESDDVGEVMTVECADEGQ